jgi:hypothetical protein
VHPLLRKGKNVITFNELQKKLNANQIKINLCLLLTFLLLVLSVFRGSWFVGNRIYQQQRQIDELCQMMITLVSCQETTKEQSGLTSGKEYGLYFADYRNGLVVLEELDPKIPGYAKRNPQWVILRGVDKKTLDTWSNASLHYGKYRKIE